MYRSLTKYIIHFEILYVCNKLYCFMEYWSHYFIIPYNKLNNNINKFTERSYKYLYISTCVVNNLNIKFQSFSLLTKKIKCKFFH